MYYKLNIDEFEKIKKVEKLMSSDYELLGDLIQVDYLVCVIEDLIYELDKTKEEFEDLKKDMEDNYIKRPMSDYTGDRYDDRF